MGHKKKIGLPGGPNEIIVDPRGQLDNPGKNTRIEGNEVTMANVDYPVWAQPNVGPPSMMQPGLDYSFPGADYVDEYPMAKKGGSVKDVHNAADLAGMEWDNNSEFMAFSKRITGKEHIDDMTLQERRALINAIRNQLPKAQKGITDKIKSYLKGEQGLIPGDQTGIKQRVKDRAYNSITPIGYDPIHALKEFTAGERLPFTWNEEQTSFDDFEKLNRWKGGNYGEYVKEASDDAWGKYLGKEQKHDTYMPSQFTPTNAKDKNAKYFSFTWDDDIWDEAVNMDLLNDKTLNQNDKITVKDSGAGGFTLSNYTLSKGFDKEKNLPYISYYDKNDYKVNVGPLNIKGEDIMGDSFEVYGRMYYDPETGERQRVSAVEQKQQGGESLPKYQKVGETKYDKDGYDERGYNVDGYDREGYMDADLEMLPGGMLVSDYDALSETEKIKIEEKQKKVNKPIQQIVNKNAEKETETRIKSLEETEKINQEVTQMQEDNSIPEWQRLGYPSAKAYYDYIADVDPGSKQALKDIASMVFPITSDGGGWGPIVGNEMFVKPAKRVYNDPKGTVRSIANTIADIGTTLNPFSMDGIGMSKEDRQTMKDHGFGWALGDNKNIFGTDLYTDNSLALDAMTFIPSASILKGGKAAFTGLKGFISKVDNFTPLISKTNNASRVVLNQTNDIIKGTDDVIKSADDVGESVFYGNQKYNESLLAENAIQRETILVNNARKIKENLELTKLKVHDDPIIRKKFAHVEEQKLLNPDDFMDVPLQNVDDQIMPLLENFNNPAAKEKLIAMGIKDPNDFFGFLLNEVQHTNIPGKGGHAGPATGLVDNVDDLLNLGIGQNAEKFNYVPNQISHTGDHEIGHLIQKYMNKRGLTPGYTNTPLDKEAAKFFRDNKVHDDFLSNDAINNYNYTQKNYADESVLLPEDQYILKQLNLAQDLRGAQINKEAMLSSGKGNKGIKSYFRNKETKTLWDDVVKHFDEAKKKVDDFDKQYPDVDTYINAPDKQILEPLAHLRELRNELHQSGIIKNFQDDITEEMLMTFWKTDAGKQNRILSFLKPGEGGKAGMVELINKTPVVAGAVGTAGIGAVAAGNDEGDFKYGGDLPKFQKFGSVQFPKINMHLPPVSKTEKYGIAGGAGLGFVSSIPNLVKNYKVDQLSEYMCDPAGGYTCPSGIGKGNQDLFIGPANTQLDYNKPVDGNIRNAWGKTALNTAIGGVTGWAASKLYDKIRGRKEGGESLPKYQIKGEKTIQELAAPPEEPTTEFDEKVKAIRKGLTTISDDILVRQAYKESHFDPKATSSAGYKGLTQIGNAVIEDYQDATGETGIDPYKVEDAVKVQNWYMQSLYNRDWNKGSKNSRIAKALAAYNMGPTKLVNILNQMKTDKIDIYQSTDWVDQISKYHKNSKGVPIIETADYIQKILLNANEDFNTDFDGSEYKEIQKKYYTPLHKKQKGGGDSTYVTQGEILPRIALKFNVSVKDIVSANPNINFRTLKSGTSLTIPGVGTIPEVVEPVTPIEPVVPVTPPSTTVTPPVQQNIPVVQQNVPVQQVNTVNKPVVPQNKVNVVNTPTKVVTTNTNSIQNKVNQQVNQVNEIEKKVPIKEDPYNIIGDYSFDNFLIEKPDLTVQPLVSSTTRVDMSHIDPYIAETSSTYVDKGFDYDILLDQLNVNSDTPELTSGTKLYNEGSGSPEERIKNYHEQIKNIDLQLQEPYYAMTNKNSTAEEYTNANSAYSKLMDMKQWNMSKINDIKYDEAGWFDSWISTGGAGTYLQKGLAKKGLIDEYKPVTDDDVNIKLETFSEKGARIEREEEDKRQEYIQTTRFDDLDTSQNQWYRWKFRASASNDDPLKVKVYGDQYERSNNPVNIKGSKGAMMHFLDQSPLSGFVGKNTKTFYNGLSDDDYVGYLDNNNDGTYSVLYKKKGDIPKKELMKNTFLIRSEKYDNINFEGRTKDSNFPGHFYWTKKDDPNAVGGIFPKISIAKDANQYDWNSGQSVVYLFPYKGKTRYVHFAGSPNAIRDEGARIIEEYSLKKNKLEVAVADAGSYSSSVRGDITQDKLQSKHYGYWNGNSRTGAGMALVGMRKGGEMEIYKDYMNGKNESQNAIDVYDKLNRKFYNEAKKVKMTPPNYIMTNLSKER